MQNSGMYKDIRTYWKIYDAEFRLWKLKALCGICADMPEFRFNPNHDPTNGRFTSGNFSSSAIRFSGGGASKGLTSGRESDIITTVNEEISAVGANKFLEGFSEENLNEHWNGSHNHSEQYPNFTKEQYASRALELIQSEADGKKILGYKLKDGTIARYDTKTNDYVKGHPNIGISTMFKPNRKSAYFHDRKRIEGGKTK